MPTLNIRLTNEQAERLQYESDELGITRGSLIKERAFGATKIMRKPRPDQIEIRRLVGQLGKVGNNLNQISHHANKTNNLPHIKYLGRIHTDLMCIREVALIALGVNERVGSDN